MADPTDNMDDGAELLSRMMRFYPLLVERAWEDAKRAGIAVAFDLDMPEVQTLLGQLGKRIVRVTETTREEVRALVGRQAAEGWSAAELATELRQLADVRSATRAITIARTETGMAYNLASVTAYRAGGVTHVTVLDGDEDEPCASANGARWTLDEAEANPLGHPNCTRAFSPIVE